MSLVNRIDNGFSTTLSFSLDPSLEFYEVEVQVPGYDGGDPINTSTMRNTLLETFSPAALLTVTDISLSVAFTSDIFDLSSGVAPMINQNQQITLTLPDGATITFWGYVRSFIPPQFVKNVRPMATIRLVPTNTNDSKVETLPVFVAA